ncbi:class II aldolase/adducin family protein [uncultured Mitsuokella sp.]|uniref:class II aldolase/adducin family protein n=1 Tax=uncultured Mitsuokella sp. TaxID=453120 RepID=UPI00266EF29D|nr:class II aldolase/adducin family protein [uncultured Mitsuokella sp.]
MLEGYKRQVVRYAQQAEREGLCRHRSGNFSVRDKETGYIVITPTGMDRAEMLPEDVVVIDMQGRVVEALTGKKPTSESMMHIAVYKARPDVGAIVHTHSKNATAFAVMNKPIPAIVYELFLLGCKKGYIPVAPYGRPGTKELAQSVLKPLEISDVALMQAHGVIAVARDLKEALLRASYVEELAEIYYKTLTVLGHEPDVVPVEELANWKYPSSLSI